MVECIRTVHLHSAAVVPEEVLWSNASAQFICTLQPCCPRRSCGRMHPHSSSAPCSRAAQGGSVVYLHLCRLMLRPPRALVDLGFSARSSSQRLILTKYLTFTSRTWKGRDRAGQLGAAVHGA